LRTPKVPKTPFCCVKLGVVKMLKINTVKINIALYAFQKNAFFNEF
jgi:hypothetical protein